MTGSNAPAGSLAARFTILLSEVLANDHMSTREIAAMLAKEAEDRPIRERAPEVSALHAYIRNSIEDSDGSWSGGDVVDALTGWLSGLGYDVPEPADGDDDDGQGSPIPAERTR